MDNIEHVVVLMLENRSFDSMLGWLYEKDSPERTIGPSGAYRGLQSVELDRFTNTAGKLKVPPRRGARGFTIPTVAPGEEFDDVNNQFFGTKCPEDGQPATMTGVLSDFVQVLQDRHYKDGDLDRIAPMVMHSYTPAQVPVLSQLARHYAVCDDWFASVPSQTNPNRAFLLCGTSNGMVDNGFLQRDPRAGRLQELMGMKVGDDRIDYPTIFNELADNGHDWAVFWQTSFAPQKISTLMHYLNEILESIPRVGRFIALIEWLTSLAHLDPLSTDYLHELTAGNLESSYTWRLFPQIQRNIADAATCFHRLDKFHELAREGNLPELSFVEPYWSIARTTTDNSLLERLVTGLGNDYHPPSNLLVGEEFVKQVYTSLISNTEAWRKTLLLITFDEFVGSFDHITGHLASGSVEPPWGRGGEPPKQLEQGFKFDRLGARVPTIVVSPYVEKRTVFRSTTQVPYDHTSLIATTMKWIGKAGDTRKFGARAANAPTFENVLTLSQPRTDERDPNSLPFLDGERTDGDPVLYGDSFWLLNQHGEYLSAAYPTMKVGGGGSLLPRNAVDLLADIGIAAYFPRYGSGDTAKMTLVTHSLDAGPQVMHKDVVRLVSREPQLLSRNVLGVWRDSSDCYYYDEFIDGEHAEAQAWQIEKIDTSQGTGVRYGDQIYLSSESTRYAGARLSRVTRRLRTDNWITTAANGDSWTIKPAPRDQFVRSIGEEPTESSTPDPRRPWVRPAWDRSSLRVATGGFDKSGFRTDFPDFSRS